MPTLIDLYELQGQSPWLDNLRRSWIHGGELAGWIERGVRGVTSNPSIFQKAIGNSTDYDDQFRELLDEGAGIEDAYWSLVVTDISGAAELLRPVHESSGGADGFVSVELAPDLARQTSESAASARDLHQRIDAPNLMVKIPGTAEGVPAVREMIGEGRNINITLIFGLGRYDQVIESYLSGLEAFEGDLSQVNSVASFFVSRVDTEIDRRLEAIGTERALALRGRAGVANAQLAYELFLDRFSGPRWDELAARGARVQRPLWASTSVKNEDYPDTLYIDGLIGPDTVSTMPEATIDAWEDHGTLARRVDADFDGARQVMADLAEVGVDVDDVTAQLEDEGVASFAKSYDELLSTLQSKSQQVR